MFVHLIVAAVFFALGLWAGFAYAKYGQAKAHSLQVHVTAEVAGLSARLNQKVEQEMAAVRSKIDEVLKKFV